ncbi:uncharacterized protein SCHCODRAFT_02134014 [Schizophyllum commune H4-8]|uniref:uncharacterized protein n=1 Tax=Schizophyllum commune (strain H4-8 / FGSC 9210) TaxID=578458 RepID=UPI0021607FC4|nr:uncharacterized protein SCHCODRAFT_02134014 [Schizophyllum commune H4-8]KAI5885205.1 hypothetical protein SCHCODRAFT_02134014 [Schizophyllum commune H4-8]
MTLADGLARNNTLHDRRKHRCARAPQDVARDWKNLTYSVAAGALTPPSYTGACEFPSYFPPSSPCAPKSRLSLTPLCLCRRPRLRGTDASTPRRPRSLARRIPGARRAVNISKTGHERPISRPTPRPTMRRAGLWPAVRTTSVSSVVVSGDF